MFKRYFKTKDSNGDILIEKTALSGVFHHLKCGKRYFIEIFGQFS
jgi:hypothetical protein